MFLTRKKVRMDMLFRLAEIKIIQSNHGIFKSINQSESSINYKETFFFSDINQSELSFNSHVIFDKFNVHQSELSFKSHVIFNKFNVNLSELSFKSHEIFKKFKVNQSQPLLLMNFSTISLTFVDFEDTFTDIICVNNQ